MRTNYLIEPASGPNTVPPKPYLQLGVGTHDSESMVVLDQRSDICRKSRRRHILLMLNVGLGSCLLFRGEIRHGVASASNIMLGGWRRMVERPKSGFNRARDRRGRSPSHYIGSRGKDRKYKDGHSRY
jgi:hypothetical protein